MFDIADSLPAIFNNRARIFRQHLPFFARFQLVFSSIFLPIFIVVLDFLSRFLPFFQFLGLFSDEYLTIFFVRPIGIFAAGEFFSARKWNRTRSSSYSWLNCFNDFMPFRANAANVSLAMLPFESTKKTIDLLSCFFPVSCALYIWLLFWGMGGSSFEIDYESIKLNYLCRRFSTDRNTFQFDFSVLGRYEIIALQYAGRFRWHQNWQRRKSRSDAGLTWNRQ